MNQLAKLKNETGGLVNTMRQILQNEDVSKEMGEIQNRIADKRQVFEELKTKYSDFTKRIEANVGQRKALLSQVELFAADIGKEALNESKWTEVRFK